MCQQSGRSLYRLRVSSGMPASKRRPAARVNHPMVAVGPDSEPLPLCGPERTRPPAEYDRASALVLVPSSQIPDAGMFAWELLFFGPQLHWGLHPEDRDTEPGDDPSNS